MVVFGEGCVRRRSALALSLLVVAAVARSAPGRPRATTQLAAARQLFSEAVADEDAKRFDTALEKFRRVAAVKDTANVRYRIASCLEALGRRAEAARELRGCREARGAGESGARRPSGRPRARRAIWRGSCRALSVVLPADAPATTEVRIDDAPVDRAALADGLLLDAGHHTIRATAPGDSPFETAVTLPEGGHVSITVTLTPVAPLAGPPAGQTLGQAPSGPSGDGEAKPAVPTHPSHVGAWIAIGVGGALAVGSVVSFVLRQSNIGTIDNDCSGSSTLQCPSSKQSEVTDARNAAQWQGPLALGLAAGAVVGVGIGAWLLATTPSQSVSVGPAFLRDGGLLVVRGRM